MSNSIIARSPYSSLEDCVLYEWLQGLDDGVVFDCHDLAQVFDLDEAALWRDGVLEGILEAHPDDVQIERMVKAEDGLRVKQLRRVVKMELGGKKPRSCSWRMWLKIVEFHRSFPVGGRYGYKELADAIGANPKYLNTIKVLDDINGAFLDTTRLINYVAPGQRGPTLMLEVTA